ncbi:NUDIX hydrolase [Parasporobacterium paucivorans]|uniref:8-oxo-dGTP diphosphatase n=1 Tax=Parasporobacterium paucivorans DSM 15970 TaxID=1122934 RepID=A0A1M6HLY5_9FIRM|nr:8-oxo-dGTP diphosphatase [Parasporobacterium paucivorans]SHJ23218.1 8-oxo-dGTP diphosphatase [Parasporobacterium paucivorans DSM 15970]
MKMTTLCYIEDSECYLMLHRIKKENDFNRDKWIGVGGKFEKDESPEECLLREVREETGLVLTSYRFRGIITFISAKWETEYMFLYTADSYEGQLVQDCKEGVLEWIPVRDIEKLSLWEGDRIFLKLLAEDAPFFSLKLRYDMEDKLIETAHFDGKYN